MLFHYTAETSINLSDSNPLCLIGAHGHFGVEAFFILSGIVIPHSMRAGAYDLSRVGQFLLKRTIRIQIPFLAIIAIEIVLIYISSLTPWREGISVRLDTFNFASHMLYLNDLIGVPWLLPNFWTLAIEFQFYVMIAILHPAISQNKRIYRILVLIGLVLFGFGFPQQYLLSSHILFFLLGIVVFQALNRIINYLEFFAVTSALLLLVFLQYGLFSFLLAASVLIVIFFFKCNFKWASVVGTISYSVYLIHIPFGGRLLLMTKTYVQSEHLRTFFIVIIFILTIILAWVFYVLVEKQSIQLSKKITYKKLMIGTPLSNNSD